jgi:predicted DNA-binding transcriptional regulator YafY
MGAPKQPFLKIMMYEDNPKRFDRIIAILIQLQSKKIIKAQDMADRFGVSLRTIYRDIRSLESSGVPILSEPGSGYSIMDGYRLPPVMFSREEAGSFVAAEKLMQQMTDKTLGAHFRSAMYKVKAVLRSREKEWVSALESQISVYKAAAAFDGAAPDSLEIVMDGIAAKKQIVLLYTAFDADTATERQIEPVALSHENNSWYIYGFCHLRSDYRQFRTDRISSIRRTEVPFTREHENPVPCKKADVEPEGTLVRIWVDKPAIKYMKRARMYYGYVEESPQAGGTVMTFRCADGGAALARWYLMFSEWARIMEPEELKDQVRALATRALERVGSTMLVPQE